MKINVLTEDQFPQYQLLSNEYGSVFNDMNWLKIFGKNLKLLSISDNDGKLVGGFFYYLESHAGIRFVKCPPFTPNNGLFFVSRTSNVSRQNSDFKNLFTEITDSFNKSGFEVLRIAFPSLYTDFQPFIWQKYKVVPNFTYVHDLNKTEDEIYSCFSAEKRNEIRKTEKDRINIHEEKDYLIIKNLIENTFLRNKIKYQENILRKILIEFSGNNNSFAYVATNNTDIIAFSFCLYDKSTAYYLFGGSTEETKHSGAGSATLWECIRRAKAIGLKVFNFEGSMNPGIEHYFRGFGGTLIPYYTVNKANIFLELILKFVRREYF